MKSEIAEALGRHRTTNHRELARNTGGRGYRPNKPNAKPSSDNCTHRPHRGSGVGMPMETDRNT